jgi:hypothetical protein
MVERNGRVGVHVLQCVEDIFCAILKGLWHGLFVSMEGL